ncbi:hypothetical protein QZH41_000166 [Actinostola sp. cb2023]|nr:hypothetical protein QZH41_000166 [Actinostola sp. cb2023]
MSCRNQCLHPRKAEYKEKLSCYCDVRCENFKDCCADYDDFCKAKKTNSSDGIDIGSGVDVGSGLTSNQTAAEDRLWSCFKTAKNMKRTKGIWMVGSCPDSWPKDDVFYQCRNLSVTNEITKENYRYLPVYTSNGRVYHNRFCAQCNGVPLQKTTSYELSLNCDVSPPQHLSSKEQIAFLFSYCSQITWAPLEGAPRRYCLNTLAKCANNAMQDQCDNAKVRIVNDNKCIYKNVHCAQCNNKISAFVCGPYRSIMNDTCSALGGSGIPSWQPKSLSVIFNFNDNVESAVMKMKVRCNDGKVFDHHLGICRKTLALPPKFSDVEQYQIVLWLQLLLSMKQGSFRVKCPTTTDIGKEIARNLDVLPEQISSPGCTRDDGDLLRVEFNLQTRQNEDIFTLRKILDFTSPFNIAIANHTFLVIKATQRALSCTSLQMYNRNEYMVSSDDQSAVYIQKTGEVLHLKDYYSTNGTSANDSQAIFVCRHYKRYNCSGQWVLMEGELTVLENRSIFMNASRRLYDWSEYFWQNRSLFVCENFSAVYFVETSTSADHVLNIMTLVCMVISIIALVFVLVTYSLFTELRTPPGINLMNLSVSILLAQLLWILGSGQTDTPMACTVIAVLLHYFFLVSFVWTSIIAFDTWRAFTQVKGRRPLADSKRNRLVHCLRHMAVGWLSIMVYVAICVVLDLTNVVTIGYQSSKACWMTNVYFFTVPVALILVFNVVLYMLTTKAINATTAQGRVATDNKHRRQTFGINVRIASVMGFTWIFGFIAPFAASFLWYPFVVLNGLQGVYIAMAFGLNQRTRDLYKNHFPCRQNRHNNSLFSKSSKNTSTFDKVDDSKL